MDSKQVAIRIDHLTNELIKTQAQLEKAISLLLRCEDEITNWMANEELQDKIQDFLTKHKKGGE